MKKTFISYTRQPGILATLIVISLLFIVNLLQVILRVHHEDFKIATRYSVDTQSVITTGYWYHLYSFGAFVLMITAFNLFVSWRLVVSKRTGMAYALLLLTVFILVCSLLVGRVIFGLASGV